MAAGHRVDEGAETRTRWWWVRHAPVTANRGRLYGASDPPADLQDTARFQGLAAALPAGAVWVTSRLERARATAATIRANGLDGAEPLIEPAFGEQSFGAWQGERYEDVARRTDKPAHRFWFTTADHCPPGGESFEQVMARVADAVARATRAHAGRDVVAVAHGGPIRAAVAHALGLSPAAALAFVIDNLSVTRLDHVDSPRAGPDWQVHYVNRQPVSPW